MTITPATVAVGTRSYPVQVDIAGHLRDQLHATKAGNATGQKPELVPATGVITFFNRSIGSVEIPEGTQVSVGGTIAFTTTKKVNVPGGAFFGDPGQKSVAVVAVEGGTSGNVAAGAIDTIDDPNLRFNRRVTNADPTGGGSEIPHSVIQQSDIDAVVAAIQTDLRQQLSDALVAAPDRLYAGPPTSEVPTIQIPDGLLGKEDTPTFELSGTLAYDRPYASRADAEAAARSALLADPDAAPPGTAIVGDSITLDLGEPVVVGEQLKVDAAVSASAAAEIDQAKVRDRIAGLTVPAAKAELAPLGKVEIDLWPGWVDRLPRLTFRIDIR